MDYPCLLTPAEGLASERWVRAIRVARELGRAFAEELAPDTVVDRIQGGRLVLPRPRAYLDLVVRPLCHERSTTAEVLRDWEEAFAEGRAGRDPRVEAFSSGCAERTFEIAARFREGVAVLARYVEAPAGEFVLSGLDAAGRPVIAYRDERFIVANPEESSSGPVRTCELSPKGGRVSADGIRRREFAGRTIVQWRCPRATG